jgi:hypothetical protein
MILQMKFLILESKLTLSARVKRHLGAIVLCFDYAYIGIDIYLHSVTCEPWNLDAVPVPSLEGFMLKLTQRGTRDTQQLQLQASNS